MIILRVFIFMHQISTKKESSKAIVAP